MWGRTRRTGSKVVGVELDRHTAAIAVRHGSNLEHQSLDLEDPLAFRRWIQSKGLDKCRCHVVLSPDAVSLLQVERPAVPDAELDEAVRWSIGDSLDYPADAAVIDCFDVPEDALRGRSSLVNVAAVNREEITRIVEQVKAAGLTLQSIDIPELSYRNLAAGQMPAGKAMALLVIEKSRGTMMIFRNNLLYLSRHIACDPELVKGRVGTAPLEQVCLEIQRSLDYFESQLGQIPPRTILAHAGAGTNALVSAVDANLSLTARMLSVDEDDTVSAGLLRAAGAAMREERAA